MRVTERKDPGRITRLVCRLILLEAEGNFGANTVVWVSLITVLGVIGVFALLALFAPSTLVSIAELLVRLFAKT